MRDIYLTKENVADIFNEYWKDKSDLVEKRYYDIAMKARIPRKWKDTDAWKLKESADTESDEPAIVKPKGEPDPHIGFV